MLIGMFVAMMNTMTANSRGNVLMVDASAVAPAQTGEALVMGSNRNPAGEVLSSDAVSLLVNGKPRIEVMGEFHFSRVPPSEWREELLKLKAGGIDIVSTYVFWIHHEEIEGQFDWKGQKDLREFVSIAQQVGLKVFVRCGPWAHGECRNGGFPDWMLHKGFKLRSDEPGYLAEVDKFYRQIAGQLSGQLWKDGGPVIGIQVENEYGGSPSHLLHLKQMARDAGMDVPYYTRTAWPVSRQAYPPGALLPMYGAYPAGFWDRWITPTGGKYSQAFFFLHERIDSEIGNDQLHGYGTQSHDAAMYPYLCCELGGGMMTSYHRRIRIDPRDIYSLALVKLGEGANLLGYYMYHGGANPDGQLTTLQESQASGYPNDLPVKSYDFQAPLGEYGQIRPHFAMLRRLHLFLHDFGGELARMPSVLPQVVPANISDNGPLRWCVRTDGHGGYLFVNNYQRLQPMAEKQDVQFEVKLGDGELLIPSVPTDIPADSSFVWPFNIELGGVKLIYATAEPVCRLEQGTTTYTVFAQIPGVPTEFAFDTRQARVEFCNGESKPSGEAILSQLKPGTDPAIRLRSADGHESVIILLDDAMSLECSKISLGGREMLCISKANVTVDGNNLDATSADEGDLSVSLFPAPAGLTCNGIGVAGVGDGIFERFTAKVRAADPIEPVVEVVRTAGEARDIRKGHGKVAEAPNDVDFDQAAVWRIKLAGNISADRDILLRIHYTGDVARLYLEGKLIDDNFYNGSSFDLGLRRFAPAVYQRELELKVLPLRSDAPIYLPSEARAEGGNSAVAALLNGIDVIENRTAQFQVVENGVTR